MPIAGVLCSGTGMARCRRCVGPYQDLSNMLTGSDVSIRECRANGYGVVEHYGKKLNPRHPYLVTISNPQYWPYGYPTIGVPSEKLYSYIGRVSYNELYNMAFQDAGFRTYVDWETYPYPESDEQPSFSELAGLAASIYHYKGL